MFDVVSKLLDRLVQADNGCQEFTGALDTGGYGIVWFEGKNKGAHIVAYEHYHGPIPEGKWVLHTCDNPRCCAEDHLFLGTRQDNVDDMHRKGRAYIRKGDEVNTSKLNAEEVLEIRQLSEQGYSQRCLGELFGVSHTAIGYIVRREHWSHI